MSMKGGGFKKSSKASDEVPTSSLADIAFLLLIFFMVTTVFQADRDRPITWPEAEAAETYIVEVQHLRDDAAAAAEEAAALLERVAERLHSGQPTFDVVDKLGLGLANRLALFRAWEDADVEMPGLPKPFEAGALSAVAPLPCGSRDEDHPWPASHRRQAGSHHQEGRRPQPAQRPPRRGRLLQGSYHRSQHSRRSARPRHLRRLSSLLAALRVPRTRWGQLPLAAILSGEVWAPPRRPW